jgi:hypothetical protein
VARTECHIDLWHLCWHYSAVKPQRKITVHIPEDLLQKALDSSGKGLTATVRQGLELVAAGRAYKQLQRLRGKVRFSVNLKALREDA